MKRIALVALVIPCFLLLNLGCSTTGGSSRIDQMEEVLLYVEMETTADWTNLVIGEKPSIVRGMVTWFSPSSTCRTHLDDIGLALNQPLAHAQAGDQVSMEAMLWVDLPTTGTFPVTIERGHIGETTVRLYRLDGELASLLEEITWSGIKPDPPENPEKYSIPVLADAGSTTVLPYDQDELDEMVARWWEALMEGSSDWQGFYWSEAEYVTLWPGEDLVIIETPHEHVENFEPDPNVDYSLLSRSHVSHIPCREPSEAKLFITEVYDGETVSSNLFRFREERGEWRIFSQTWKIGFELP